MTTNHTIADNNSSGIVPEPVSTSNETAVGSGDLTRKATGKLSAEKPSSAGHPDTEENAVAVEIHRDGIVHQGQLHHKENTMLAFRRSEMGDEADARAKNDLLINSAGVSIVFNLTPSEIQELSENRERPDEECYFPEAVGCSEGIGNVHSLTDLMVWHRCRVDDAIDYASTSLDMIDGYFDDMIGELANTWRGRRNLFAKVLGVDLKNGDTEVDAEFVKNTFDLSDAAIQEQIEYSRENPDEPYLFPLPTNCSEGSGAQFFSLAKLLCWHKHRVETVVNKAKIALREARATIVPVMNELHSTWIGRKAILEKLLDVDIDLSNMYDYHHEEDE